MLTFNEKLEIIETFPDLERKNVSLGRVNFQLKMSISDKKNIVYHLHPNGNGYVYASDLPNYDSDDKGLVNIRDFTAQELKDIIQASIHSLTEVKKSINEQAIIGEQSEERWINDDQDQLILIYENEAWNIYFGLNLDATFDTYGEAVEFLEEEGFQRT